MIDSYARRLLPRLVKPLLAVYQRYHVHPSSITIAAFVLAVAASGAVAYGCSHLAIGMWWLSRLGDGTDGIWARQSQQTSALGAFLDLVLDMGAYGVMIIGFAYRHAELQFYWMSMLVLYAMCVTSALMLGGLEEAWLRRAGERLDLQAERQPPAQEGVQRRGLRHDNRGARLATGLAEGGETGLAYTAFLLFPAAIDVLALLWISILVITVVARGVLIKKMF